MNETEQKRVIKIGIIGPGHISRLFADGLAVVPDTKIAAVASTSMERARLFAEQYGIATLYDDYAKLFADPNIDLIYIGLINTKHFKVARQAILAGKAVLLEKPFTINAYETNQLLSLARERGVFLMEAMWTRFHPLTRHVLEWCEAGKIGAIRRIDASFGYAGGDDESRRHLNPFIGGGALLDVGIYPLSYASMLLGKPTEIKAVSLNTSQGIDRQIEITAAYGQATASLAASVLNQLDNTARIFGETGFIEVPCFFNPSVIRRYDYGNGQAAPPLLVETIEHVETANGYEYEAIAASEAIRHGEQEHAWMPLSETLDLMQQMDEIRQQIGLVYPAERAVLFDCDGVLVHSEPLLNEIICELLAARGIDTARVDFTPYTGTGEATVLAGVLQAYGQAYDPALKQQLYDRYDEIAPQRLKAIAGAKALIEALLAQGIKVAVASSADRQKVETNLRVLGLPSDAFDAVVTGSDVARKKPQPDIYIAAANAVGVMPALCVVVEDAPAGVQAARAAGMETIAITSTLTAEYLHDAGADVIVDTMADIAARFGMPITPGDA